MKKAIPEILSRLTIGIVFVESGWGKFHDLPKVVSYFESLNIPLANIQAPFVSGVELVAGLFILVGLFTRVSSLLLIAIMTVALITAKREDITDASSLLGLSEFLYILILSWLVFYGSKALSVDAMICKRRSADSCKMKGTR